MEIRSILGDLSAENHWDFNNFPETLKPTFQEHSDATRERLIQELHTAVEAEDFCTLRDVLSQFKTFLNCKYPITLEIRKELIELLLPLLENEQLGEITHYAIFMVLPHLLKEKKNTRIDNTVEIVI